MLFKCMRRKQQNKNWSHIDSSSGQRSLMLFFLSGAITCWFRFSNPGTLRRIKYDRYWHFSSAIWFMINNIDLKTASCFDCFLRRSQILFYSKPKKFRKSQNLVITEVLLFDEYCKCKLSTTVNEGGALNKRRLAFIVGAKLIRALS